MAGSSRYTLPLPKLGVDFTFVENPDDPESWQAAVKPNTKAFYGETFGNPIADVLDIPAVAEVAHNNQVPLIVDNTMSTAALVRPLELGADIVVLSTTKFYTGNGAAIGGAIVGIAADGMIDSLFDNGPDVGAAFHEAGDALAETGGAIKDGISSVGSAIGGLFD